MLGDLGSGGFVQLLFSLGTTVKGAVFLRNLVLLHPRFGLSGLAQIDDIFGHVLGRGDHLGGHNDGIEVFF